MWVKALLLFTWWLCSALVAIYGLTILCDRQRPLAGKLTGVAMVVQGVGTFRLFFLALQ